MVNPGETVELDPEPEEILSVWGKELTTHNLEHFFGASSFHRTVKENRDLNEPWNNFSVLEGSKGSLGLVLRKIQEDQAYLNPLEQISLKEELPQAKDFSVPQVSNLTALDHAQYHSGRLEDVVYG